MAIKQEINAPLIVTVGAVSGLLLIVIGVGVEAWFKSEERGEIASKIDDRPSAVVPDVKAEQLARVNEYRWVDQRAGVVAIPVSEAMKVMVQNKGKFPATQQ